MCENNECNEMIQASHAENGKRILHTPEECKLLSKTNLGTNINDFDADNIVFACLFIHRM